ncbi:hypothetical protein [Desulfosarcina cetonica]|uniref:hypothetical protein n=1 Tax=Desulfosarcina cetonica TaxID=90730 RepID=UPI0006D28ED4|nr:hypothetical protein [Desulfosarcina cetonica]
MHNLTDKMCPLMGKTCLLNGCTFFNEILDACEIGILSYNLYQLKEKIRLNWLMHGKRAFPSRRHILSHPAVAVIRDQCVNV